MKKPPDSIASLRALFPLYAPGRNNETTWHYLDNAATTFKPQSVIDAQHRYYADGPANVHRATHRLAEKATGHFEDTRTAVARFLNARDAREIIFTHGTTESLNLVARSWAASRMKPGETILLTEMEHHSNIIPWRLTARDHNLRIDYVPVTTAGTLDLDALREKLTPSTRILSITLMSNVLGTMPPIHAISAWARSNQTALCLDAAQAVAHAPVDVQELDCDFLAFSAHKLFGPTGIGILYARDSRLQQMTPFLGGGDMINTVSLDHETWADPPHRFEAGTPHIAGTYGLGAAVAFLQQVGYPAIMQHEKELTAYLEERLRSLPGVRLLGSGQHIRHGLVSFQLDGLHPHDVAQFADQARVALRAGTLCAQPLLRKMGHQAVCRASLSLYNNHDDIDALHDALLEARRFFHGA